MKLHQLLKEETETETKGKAYLFFSFANDNSVSLETLETLEDVKSWIIGEAVDSKNIIVKEVSEGEGVWQLEGNKNYLEVNHDEGSHNTIFHMKAGKIVTDKYDFVNPISSMVDTDTPEGKELAAKIASRKKKK